MATGHSISFVCYSGHP